MFWHQILQLLCSFIELNVSRASSCFRYSFRGPHLCKWQYVKLFSWYLVFCQQIFEIMFFFLWLDWRHGLEDHARKDRKGSTEAGLQSEDGSYRTQLQGTVGKQAFGVAKDVHIWRWFLRTDLIIDRVALAKKGDNALGSVRPSVCPSVCPFTLSCLNRLTFDLDIWCEGRPWPWLLWEYRSRS